MLKSTLDSRDVERVDARCDARLIDFQLRELPLSDHYTCNVGSDRYLEALRREHPDRAL